MEMVRCMMVVALIVLPLMAEGALLGGWKPIKDVKDPEVVEIAKYAVSEHNKQSKSDLRYVGVVSGQEQVVSGINYKLVVSATEGSAGKTTDYEAVVWVKSWEHFKELRSFKPLV